ncbi:hypothetical protein H5410_005747 [Solanum commersonii]|uniref:Uncharacterized protein n=1 Tax=Solanum commersonii TaxID=4109 RepID=A0A9J6A7P2_SOLCO|nr:hypothetical protein H5410_005747 [Solanum commersonii]
MTEDFRRQNQNIDRLEKEKERLTQHVHLLEERIKILQFNINQTIPLQKPKPDNSKEQKSYLSHFKMGKTGVHFPKNVERATVSAKGTSSLVQTVMGKDLSNLLMADTLPKSVRILPASFSNIATTGAETSKKRKGFISLYKLLNEKTKEVIQEYPNPEPEPVDSDPEDSASDEYDPSMDQFAQDPNEDDDSGMSFDTEALHNLDT